MRNKTDRIKQIPFLALFAALAILLGYVETLLPMPVALPGIKLGLCNIVILCVLSVFSWKEALAVSAVRVLVIGFMFGNLYSIAYGLAGSVLSILVMSLLFRSGKCGMLGISAAGGALHNVGQLLVAKAVLPAFPLLAYLPVLLLAGAVTGVVIGVLCFLILTRVQRADLFRTE